MANKSKQHRNKGKTIQKLYKISRSGINNKSLSRNRNSARSKYAPSIEDKKHSLT